MTPTNQATMTTPTMTSSIPITMSTSTPRRTTAISATMTTTTPITTTIIPTTTTTVTPTATWSISTTTTITPKTTTTTTPTKNTTAVTTTVVTTAPEKMRPSTSAFLMPSPTKDFQPDGKGTVTQSPDPLWHCKGSAVILTQDTWICINKGVYIGISVIISVLFLTFLVFMINKSNLFLSNKLELRCVILLRDSHVKILKNADVNHVRAEDNVDIIDDQL
uniref:Uncharacterized protein n=1 Tax=Bos mutus grunniens TaxID=30521 RepID=A0A8B9XMR9_BOSMU